ncbi:Rieske (2Fe-2S) protein [Gloeothece verrucosa]|uniref:Rieske (2Fe-2S) iron-sulfur domain protein n=1 Tax=Gloeothece verrucosa (strain PCC 7822) TaxID=497965 RepID=E0UKS8_GLOV7|nr:Rieske (2Fe-2S) protein [Gloeothece verrucosa]ADN17558.1 Rieske (2Fe-2S) iron-sulfur domain protein [Gloeothece verrucosa PCC 7822]
MNYSNSTDFLVRAALYEEVKSAGSLLVRLQNLTISLWIENGKIYALDNRCPHMGFPLHGSPCKDGIVTCPWHYARFDAASGGTFDSWADDVRAFPVKVIDGEVWVNLAASFEPIEHQRQRLTDGLQQGISLVIAKSTLALLQLNISPVEPFQKGLRFGTRYNQAGWGSGLSILTCLMNLLPYLDEIDKPLALYQGLSAVANDSTDTPPRWGVHPLPHQPALGEESNLVERFKRWFRSFIEVRNAEAAERTLVSAITAGINPLEIADILFSAATDHRYLDVGHTVDFINKALEALDINGWQDAELVLGSLVSGLANASRMEESNAWRYPVDLAAMLPVAFDSLPSVLEKGQSKRGQWSGQEKLVSILLEDDPQKIIDALLNALSCGCTEEQLAGVVAYAASLRIAQFNLNNEFSDWDSAHHSFTFAHAVHQGLRRVNSIELLRAVFDAAMSIYLNRFLNIPPARLPSVKESDLKPDELLKQLPELFDRQQQVSQAAHLVASYLYQKGDAKKLMAMLGKLMLRENRDFHVIQEMEAAFKQYSFLNGSEAGIHILVAATRYLAAHAPTRRTSYQTYQIAERLSKGDRLFEAEN